MHSTAFLTSEKDTSLLLCAPSDKRPFFCLQDVPFQVCLAPELVQISRPAYKHLTAQALFLFEARESVMCDVIKRRDESRSRKGNH